MSNTDKTVVVRVPDEYRDLIQRLHLEWFQKDRSIRGYIEDHQFDDDPGEFFDSPSFKAYEERCAKALLAYETAKEDLENRFVPEKFKGKNYKWELNYSTCELTYTLA